MQLNQQKQTSVRRKLVILAAVMAVIVAITFANRLLSMIENPWLMRLCSCLLYAALAVPAVVGMRLSGVSLKKQLDFANGRQYLWAAALFAVMSLAIAVIPALLGTSLIGGHTSPSIPVLIYGAVFYIVFVGPVEELIFRGYAQELLVEILPKHRWLGAVIAAALFGLWHGVNGSLAQVIFTFAIGLFWGLMKYFFKNCTLVSTALGHGVYDFMNIIVRIFLIK